MLLDCDIYMLYLRRELPHYVVTAHIYNKPKIKNDTQKTH